MKAILVLAVMGAVVAQPRVTASTTYGHQSPVNEARMGIQARLNLDQGLVHQFTHGLTDDYHDMLQNKNKYFLSNGLTTTRLDQRHQVVIGKHVDTKNLDYTYSSLPEQTPDPMEQYTSDYQEMLTNPDKKFLVLGIHPELSTPETRTIAESMEDPVFVPSAEEIQEQQEAMKAQQKKQADKIEYFLQLIRKDHLVGKNLTEGQKRVLDELENVTLPSIYDFVKNDIQQVRNISEQKEAHEQNQTQVEGRHGQDQNGNKTNQNITLYTLTKKMAIEMEQGTNITQQNIIINKTLAIQEHIPQQTKQKNEQERKEQERKEQERKEEERKEEERKDEEATELPSLIKYQLKDQSTKREDELQKYQIVKQELESLKEKEAQEQADLLQKNKELEQQQKEQKQKDQVEKDQLKEQIKQLQEQQQQQNKLLQELLKQRKSNDKVEMNQENKKIIKQSKPSLEDELDEQMDRLYSQQNALDKGLDEAVPKNRKNRKPKNKAKKRHSGI